MYSTLICEQSIRELADRCTAQNETSYRECQRRLGALLEEGVSQTPRQVAKRFLRQIERQTAECNELLERRCRNRVELLLEMGAEELAQRLRDLCQGAARRIRDSEKNAVNRIRSLLEPMA